MLILIIFLVLFILKAEAMDTEIGAVILTANNQSLTYVTTLSVNCDGEANYTYEDGEDMYFSCKKAHVEYLRFSDPLRLEYYNVEGILLFQTKPRETPHVFRSVLKSHNDKYYLDCIRIDGVTEREYRYRTTFNMKKRDLYSDAEHHAMILSVNGQTLTVITNNIKISHYYDVYLYRYIDGEVLNVTCRKTDINMRGTLSFNNYDESIAPYISPVVRSPLEGYITLNVSATKINRKVLTFCINNSDVQKPNARLLFLSDVTENGVRIRGLSRHNVLYQYTNDFNKWTIEYQYSVNDTLNLNCVSKGSIFVKNQRFQWEFNGETSISAALLTPTMVIVSNKTFTKILDATHNGKTINCVYIPNSYFKTKRVEIILRLKPEANSGQIISSKTFSNVNISAKSSWLILGSSIGAVLVILGLTGVACWYVRTRNPRNNIETTYGDLTYQNDSPQCTNEYENQYDTCYSEIPSNRETYNETPRNVDNNTDPEDHYTEIDLTSKKYKLVVPSLVYDVKNNDNF